MALKKTSHIALISIFILSLICGGVVFLFSLYEIVEGKLVDGGYEIKSSVTLPADANSPAATVEEIDYFYLVIEVNGKTSTYKVNSETFMKALNGQNIFRMLCTPISCAVIE